MFDVFIVDDEDLARDRLRTHIQDTCPSLNICGEAADGECALMQILDLKPDILLLDIQIPHMNGLEVARKTKETLPWIQIVIISGYDEFEYARRAVDIGVNSYLLKPIEWQDLDDCLHEAEERISAARREYQNAENIQRTDRMVLERFLTRITTAPVTQEELESFQAQHGMMFTAARYVVCRAKMPHMSQDDFAKLHVLGTQMFGDNSHVLWFIKGGDCFVCILTGDTEEDLMEDAYRTAQIIRHELEDVLGIQSTIGIGTVVATVQELPRSYMATQEVTELSVSIGPSKIISYEDYHAFEMNASLGYQDLQEVNLLNRIHSTKPSELEALIQEIYMPTQEKTANSLLLRFYRLMQLLTIIQEHTEDQALKEQIAKMTPRQILELANSYEETRRFSYELIVQALPMWKRESISTYREILLQAKQYIAEHYDDPDISLGSVAKAVGFSPNHFSTIFSQETGKTFIEYLTDHRIGAAKRLIEQGEKFSDIAFKIGYTDPAYFSFAFKKKVGISPREYRRRSQEDKG